MPKLKTRKVLAKRFKITKTGKVLRGHSNSRHLKANKSRKLKRHYREPIQVTDKQAKLIKSMIAG
jgi:large subunit ribosomal protein L35